MKIPAGRDHDVGHAVVLLLCKPTGIAGKGHVIINRFEVKIPFPISDCSTERIRFCVAKPISMNQTIAPVNVFLGGHTGRGRWRRGQARVDFVVGMQQTKKMPDVMQGYHTIVNKKLPFFKNYVILWGYCRTGGWKIRVALNFIRKILINGIYKVNVDGFISMPLGSNDGVGCRAIPFGVTVVRDINGAATLKFNADSSKTVVEGVYKLGNSPRICLPRQSGTIENHIKHYRKLAVQAGIVC